MGAEARGELLCLGRGHSQAKWPIFPQLKHGKLLVGNYCGSVMVACSDSEVGVRLNWCCCY
jgi:hypothetical protein